MKIGISICTGLMLNGHSNPYIESTTILSDIAYQVAKSLHVHFITSPMQERWFLMHWYGILG